MLYSFETLRKDFMLTYISLFSCAGVGCYGFKQQGFQCIATNELIKKRLDVQMANDKCKYESGYIQGSISEQTVKDAIMQEIAKWKDIENLKDVDVIVATPPCQGMSTANQYKKDETLRNSLVIDAITMIKDIKPKFFVFENVTAFPKTTCLDTDGVLKRIDQAFYNHLDKDYSIVFQIMNFVDYGSNSSRKRCLTLGIRKDVIELDVFSLNVEKDNFFPKKQNPKTIRQCTSHLPSVNGGEWYEEDLFHYSNKLSENHLFWIEKVREGQSAFNQEDLDRRPKNLTNKMGNKLFRCYWDKPALCVHGTNRNLCSQSTGHPKDNRVFTIREIMIFQTIPNEFRWFKEEVTKESVLKHYYNIRECVGESVPTRIFEQIAKNIKDFLQTKCF
jgi:DNA (cytosine-5)-methyltransferase 1